MNVTFDTNTFGPICSPVDYQGNPDMAQFSEIKKLIALGKINPYISEASLSLEALKRSDRIDKFIREWATKSKGIEVPKPAPVRVKIVEKAFELGMKVLNVPRIALGAFIEVPEYNWASDVNYTAEERQERYFKFTRDFPYIGPFQLKELGAELVTLHNIDTSYVINFPSWPKPNELLWSKGIIAEYDNPKKFNSTKQFTKRIRNIIAEWNDLDILASHYGYGMDLFCTNDRARETGSRGIFHTNNQQEISLKYNIKITNPAELVEKIE